MYILRHKTLPETIINTYDVWQTEDLEFFKGAFLLACAFSYKVKKEGKRIKNFRDRTGRYMMIDK